MGETLFLVYAVIMCILPPWNLIAWGIQFWRTRHVTGGCGIDVLGNLAAPALIPIEVFAWFRRKLRVLLRRS
jgi:hypothetical protein